MAPTPRGAIHNLGWAARETTTPMKSPIVKRSIQSTIVKHSINLRGHKTSLSLEAQFWTALKEIAAQREMAMSDLIDEIDAHRTHNNLSSAARLFVLGVYKKQLAEYVRPQPSRSEWPA